MGRKNKTKFTRINLANGKPEPAPVKTNTQKNETTIEELDDKCLSSVLSHLPLLERIKVERVNKKWKKVSESLWSYFNNEDLFKELEQHNMLSEKIRDRNEVFTKILSKYGNEIKKLDTIDNDYTKIDLRFIMKRITMHCSNIEKMYVYGTRYVSFENKFRDFFTKNKKLQYLKVDMVTISGRCLLNIPINSLQTLDLSRCFIVEARFIYSAIKRLRNLKSLFVRYIKGVVIDSVLDALLKSDHSHKIKEIALLPYEDLEVIESTKFTQLFLTKLKTVTYVEINFIQLDKKKIIGLPVKTIEYLDLSACSMPGQDFHFCLSRAAKLKTFVLKGESIADEHAKAIGSCSSLTKLELSSCAQPYFLTAIGLRHFTNLINLVELNVSENNGIDDHFLSVITSCNKLTIVNISECKNVTDIGLGHIVKLPELRNLDFSKSERITGRLLKPMLKIEKINCESCTELKNDGLCKLVTGSPNLKYINVSDCKNINNLLIERAKKAFKIRSKDIILKIVIKNTLIVKNSFKSIPPFIQLLNE